MGSPGHLNLLSASAHATWPTGDAQTGIMSCKDIDAQGKVVVSDTMDDLRLLNVGKDLGQGSCHGWKLTANEYWPENYPDCGGTDT